MMFFGDCYRKCRVLVTGHTGFKGSWLCEWLCRLGADVYGISLPPEGEFNHHRLLSSPVKNYFFDIREPQLLKETVEAIAPEVVFHLAAQALVLESYRTPVETFEVNVMGTLRLLDALRGIPSCRAVVVVTSDKCYDNRESGAAFNEDAPMGGKDPYSASKGCTELAVRAWRESFFPPEKCVADGKMLIATARAGNVVGGGDWAANRLIPDLARAAAAGKCVMLRHPQAVRPFQHVLEPLAGYLELGRRLLSGDASVACGWNFGPAAGDALPVIKAAELFVHGWPEAGFTAAEEGAALPPEAGVLRLDTSRAEKLLGISNIWDNETLFRRSAVWYRDFYRSGMINTAADIDAFTAEAAEQGVVWTK